MNTKQTISLRLEPTIQAAAQSQATLRKRDLGDYLTYLIIQGLLREGAFDGDPVEARKLKLREELLEAVVAKAEEISAQEAGDDVRKDITAATCAAIVEDAKWRADYEEFVEADAFATGVQLKSRINPRIGARIKSGLGLHSRVRADNGKTETYNVSGNIIRLATALSRFAPPEGDITLRDRRR